MYPSNLLQTMIVTRQPNEVISMLINIILGTKNVTKENKTFPVTTHLTYT